MAERNFLNPLLKAALCAGGMFLMGYYLYHASLEGALYEQLNIVRGLVFLGFSYLLAQSLRQLLEMSGHKKNE
ncbi:MAG: hypothetical protein FJ118_12025 [Deltaproteobacteria bacterium]|nr:hypothetical protein [Deltaproteobacteria bacterium]